jgi:hypothetical protein
MITFARTKAKASRSQAAWLKIPCKEADINLTRRQSRRHDTTAATKENVSAFPNSLDVKSANLQLSPSISVANRAQPSGYPAPYS